MKHCASCSFHYRDNNQKEIDLVYARDGELFRVKMKSGTVVFSTSDVKGFKQPDQSGFIKGNRAIVCTADKLSALSDGTLIIPVSSM